MYIFLVEKKKTYGTKSKLCIIYSNKYKFYRFSNKKEIFEISLSYVNSLVKIQGFYPQKRSENCTKSVVIINFEGMCGVYEYMSILKLHWEETYWSYTDESIFQYLCVCVCSEWII